MKSASSAARTEFILYDAIQGNRAHPVCLVEYLNDSGAWVELEDLTRVSISRDGQDRRYGSFSLLPSTTTASFSFVNASEKYSPGRGGIFDGVLIRNRPVRVWMGYNVQEAVSKTFSVDVSSYQGQLYHTQIIASKVYNSMANAGGAPALTGIAFFMYGEYTYDDVTYEIEGYYLMDPIDTRTNPREILQTISVLSDTALIKCYYRTSKSTAGLALENFAYVANTINGTATLNFPNTTDRFIQFAFVWGTGVWSSTTGYIGSLVLNYTDTVEYFQQGDFLLDDPTFSATFGKASASCQGRDYFKRAFETEVSLPAISGLDIVAIIRMVCDRASIPYTATTLPLVSSLVSVAAADNFKNAKAINIFDKCITYLAGYVNKNYRLRLNDAGNLELFLRVDTAASADWVADYRVSLFSIAKGYASNNLLQRITVLNKEQTTDEETLLASAHYATTGAKTLSWVGGAQYFRINLTWNATSGGYITIQHANPTSLDFTVFGTAVNLTMNFYGCKEKGTAFYGEAISADNSAITSTKQISTGLQVKNGFTYKLTNIFIASNAIALSIAEKLINEFGNRLFEISIDIPGNPLLEINDKIMVFEKYTNSHPIYIVTGISHSYSAEGAEFTTALKLIDFGFILNLLQYDLNGLLPGAGDFNYDTGYSYEMDLGFGQTDTTDYNYLIPKGFP